MKALSTPVAIIVAALIVSITLLFGDRYQITSHRDNYLWRVDKLTGTVWSCGTSSNACRPLRD